MMETKYSKNNKVKKSLSATLILMTIVIKSQVAIGKTSVTNNSVSLEFSDSEKKGIVMPYVENKDGVTENGTIIFDTTDYKLKYLKGGNWFDLTIDNSGKTGPDIQQSKTELTDAKVIIGTTTDTANGILVLSDNNKAMILPKVVSPHLNIIDPAPGMMVYDSEKKQLAVYNGTVWTFWKP